MNLQRSHRLLSQPRKGRDGPHPSGVRVGSVRRLGKARVASFPPPNMPVTTATAHAMLMQREKPAWTTLPEGVEDEDSTHRVSLVLGPAQRLVVRYGPKNRRVRGTRILFLLETKRILPDAGGLSKRPLIRPSWVAIATANICIGGN